MRRRYLSDAAPLQALAVRLRRHAAGECAMANAIGSAHGWASREGRAAEGSLNRLCYLAVLIDDALYDAGLPLSDRGRDEPSAAAARMLANEPRRLGRRITPMSPPTRKALLSFLSERVELLEEFDHLARPYVSSYGRPSATKLRKNADLLLANCWAGQRDLGVPPGTVRDVHAEGRA